MTTVYLSFAETSTPGEQERGFPFRLTSRLSEKTTSADGQRRAVGEVDVPPGAGSVNVLASALRPRTDEQRDRMGEVVLPVREQRVVDRAVDDRRGGVERALRVERVERERVVDDERRRRSRADRRAARRRRDDRCDERARVTRQQCAPGPAAIACEPP